MLSKYDLPNLIWRKYREKSLKKFVYFQDSYAHVQKCCSSVRPNRAFVEQLSRWEEDVFGEKSSDISDPNF